MSFRLTVACQPVLKLRAANWISLRRTHLLPPQIHSNHSRRRKDLASANLDTQLANFDEVRGVVNLLLRIGLGITCIVLLVSALLILLVGLLTDDGRNHELT
jgi:hypothetical protein